MVLATGVRADRDKVWREGEEVKYGSTGGGDQHGESTTVTRDLVGGRSSTHLWRSPFSAGGLQTLDYPNLVAHSLK